MHRALKVRFNSYRLTHVVTALYFLFTSIYAIKNKTKLKGEAKIKYIAK